MRPVRHIEAETGKVIRSHVARSDRCRKLSYASRKRAAATAKAQTRATGELIEPYHCGPCHAWHIGHPPGTRGEHTRACVA